MVDASPPLLSSMPVHSVDGLRLHTETVHAGDELHVLFAHGFGQTRQSWSAAQKRLAQLGFSSTSYDARGHGESDYNPNHSVYSHEQFIDDIVAVTRNLNTKPLLVGASMGGLIGVASQSRHQLFSGLILVDVTPRWESAGMHRILQFMRAHPDGFESYEHAADEIARYLPHRTERKSADQLKPLLKPNSHGRLQWHWDPRMLGEFAENTEHLQEQISEAARQIRVPTLLISGGRSDLVSQQTVQHFLECVPHAQHVQIAQATHMVAGDENDQFTHTILNFIGAHYPHSSRQAVAV
jgi:pimeloyl-ACP methyl ester carboxylesterase